MLALLCLCVAIECTGRFLLYKGMNHAFKVPYCGHNSDSFILSASLTAVSASANRRSNMLTCENLILSLLLCKVAVCEVFVKYLFTLDYEQSDLSYILASFLILFLFHVTAQRLFANC